MSDTAVGVVVTLTVFALIVVVLGLITMFAWNIGVVALVAASGGSVGKIGFLPAIAINFAIGVVRRIFNPATAVKSG